MASSLFGGTQKPNLLQSAMQAVNMMRHANPEQVMHQMMQSNPQFAEFINANKGKSPEQTQKVLDTITGNRMADMQNQINQLQLSQAMCGVVRYPNTFAYNAGPSPFCGNGCCGTANI